MEPLKCDITVNATSGNKILMILLRTLHFFEKQSEGPHDSIESQLKSMDVYQTRFKFKFYMP